MARGKDKGNKRRSVTYARYGYIFILPFFLIYFTFSLYPLLSTFFYSATNIGGRTAEFYGFDDLTMYYDQHLDLRDYYTQDFKGGTGVEVMDYTRMKDFFSLQQIAREMDPLNEDGLEAIAMLSTLSDKTRSEVQAVIDTRNPARLSDDAVMELNAYRDEFDPLDVRVMDALPQVQRTVDSILHVEETAVTDVVADDAETQIDPEEAIQQQVYDLIADLEELSDTEPNEDNERAFMMAAFLATMLNDGQDPANAIDYLISFYQNYTELGEASIYEEAFFTTTRDLEKEGAVGTSITADLRNLHMTETWPQLIESLSTIDRLDEYMTAERTLHDDDLYDDLLALHNAGVLELTVLVEEDGKFVTDEREGLLYQLRRLIDTEYETNPDELRAVAHMRRLLVYMTDRTYRVPLNYYLTDQKGLPGGVDKYINFDDDRVAKKELFYEFKENLGLSETLSYERYVELDEHRKAERVAIARREKADAQEGLSAAQAAFDAALVSGDNDEIRATREALATLEVTITRSDNTIRAPRGLLERVSSYHQYIFVGLDNFESMIKQTTRFNTVTGVLTTTMVMWLIGFIPQLLLALVLASWMTDARLRLKGVGAMKAFLYLPNIMTMATIAIFFYRSFSFQTNPQYRTMAQHILALFGRPEGYNFFNDPWATRLIVAFINFWMWYGHSMIVLIAGIVSISDSIFESAQIDGASSGQTFRRITLPMIRPMMLYVLVTSLIGGLQMFDIPQLLQEGQPLISFRGTMIYSTETILMYIRRQAFGSSGQTQIGLASAISVLLFVITVLLSIIVFRMMRDKDEAKARKIARLAARKGGGQ